PQNPHFYILEAESYIAEGPYRCPTWKVKPLLDRAQQLLQQMPPDDQQKALLELVKQRQQLLGLQGFMTGAMPLDFMDEFMDPFDDDFDDEDYDDEYY